MVQNRRESESSQIRKVGSRGLAKDEADFKIRHIQLQKFPKSMIADNNKVRREGFGD